MNIPDALMTMPHAVRSRESDILTAIRSRDVHLAIWERRNPAGLDGLLGLALNEISDIDEEIAIGDTDASLEVLLGAAGYPASLRKYLAEETAMLAGVFTAIMDCSILRLRLEVVETNACHKFHADNVTARMIAPLIGQGTQWRAAAADDRAEIHQLRTGEVALFKGRKWVEKPAILHRSPPIAGTGQRRLLLVLDPLGANHEDRNATDAIRI